MHRTDLQVGYARWQRDGSDGLSYVLTKSPPVIYRIRIPWPQRITRKLNSVSFAATGSLATPG